MKKKIIYSIFFSVVVISIYITTELTRPFLNSDFDIKIKKNTTLSELIHTLKDQDIKKQWIIFPILKIISLHRSVKRGAYRISSTDSPISFIKKIFCGNQDPIKVTFSSVKNIEELVQIFSSKLDIPHQQLFDYINSEENIKKYGFITENILTLFIPNTYEFYWTISAEKLLEKFYEEYRKFWTKDRLQKCDNLKLSPIEVAILASIVQSETNKIDEAPKISGVYINRLHKGIPICSCPTIFFHLKGSDRLRLLKKDLEIESQYNTYKKKGLPIGPIRLASPIYIDAVLNSTKHNFLYFCAKEDFSGYHYFATNLRDHINNSKKYKRELDKRKIFS